MWLKRCMDKLKKRKSYTDIYSIFTTKQIEEAQKELDKYILEMMKRY